MEHIIAKLLQDFEQGKMSRRQLLQSLALTAAAASAAGAAQTSAASGTKLQGVGISHISFDVADYQKTSTFYADLFGIELFQGTLKTQNHGRVGKSRCPHGTGPTHCDRGRTLGEPRRLQDYRGAGGGSGAETARVANCPDGGPPGSGSRRLPPSAHRQDLRDKKLTFFVGASRHGRREGASPEACTAVCKKPVRPALRWFWSARRPCQ